MRGKVSLLVMGTPPIEIANLGMADSLILMVMALVVFGPRRLPDRPPDRQAHVRVPQGLQRLQVPDGRGTAHRPEEADRRKQEEERLKALALAAPNPAEPVTPVQTSSAADIPSTAPAAPTSPADDPYSQENLYPPAPPATSEPVTAPEVSMPRIMPPSIGGAGSRCATQRRGDLRDHSRPNRRRTRTAVSSRRAASPRRPGNRRSAPGAANPPWSMQVGGEASQPGLGLGVTRRRRPVPGRHREGLVEEVRPLLQAGDVDRGDVSRRRSSLQASPTRPRAVAGPASSVI